MAKYKIADVVVDMEIRSPYLIGLCADFEYCGNEPSDFTLEISKADLRAQHEKYPQRSFGQAESSIVFNKLGRYLLENKRGLIFHSSAVAVDGYAYLFTAHSGVGKSTHARLWRELLGNKALMVNDDKPMLTLEDGKVYVNGTPWQGKHNLGNNVKVPVKAICSVERGRENLIEHATPSEMAVTVLQQTVRPDDGKTMSLLLELIDTVLSRVDLYKLKCTPSLESARLSYTTMSGEKHEN